MYKKADARMGAISGGPSARACNNILIPPVLATRSISMSTENDVVSLREVIDSQCNSLTYLRQRLHAYWPEGIFGVFRHRNERTHDRLGERDGARCCTFVRVMSLRTNFNDCPNELDDLLLLYSMFVVTCQRPECVLVQSSDRSLGGTHFTMYQSKSCSSSRDTVCVSTSECRIKR